MAWEAGEGVFQTSAAELALDLAPRPDCRAEALAEIAPPATPGALGDCRYGVWLRGFPDEMEIPLRIASWNPSATILTGDRVEHGESIGVVFTGAADLPWPDLPGPTLDHVGTYHLCGGDAQVFRRPAAWFRERCRPRAADLDRAEGT